jgi:AcrR family transcriptional regulator
MQEMKNYSILREAQRLILKHGYEKVTMTDIADACGISRPTLYKSFPNKESVIVGLINEALEQSQAETLELMEKKGTLKSKLEKFFDIWTIQPAASVINLETGRDILMNVANYAPAAVENHYKVFEETLTTLIKHEVKKRKDISAEDLAHILTLASKGLKASTGDIKDLKRMIAGLITITVAAIS